MLDRLRNFGRSWVAKILIGLLIVAVAGFGIPSVFLDLNANTVARVGEENISVQEFQRVYQGQLNQFAQQTGSVPTPEQALQFGVPNAAIARLANDAATDGLANQLDLGASDDKLAEFVRRDPNFAGALGLFDTNEFRAMLRQSGYTESEYLDLQRDIANRQQIGYIFDGAQLPSVAADLATGYENDQRSIDYVELNPVLFEVTEEPSEDELAVFFEENQSQFRTVETRDINLLALTSETLANSVEVSDEEIAAQYEQNPEQFAVAERRTIHQLPLADSDVVQSFEDGAASGRSFASVVTETGLQTEVTELGTLTQEEVTDPAIAEAAFSLDEGSYTVIESADGSRVVWVSSIEPAGQQPLEDVRGDIAQSLREDQARDILFEVYDAIEEARGALRPLRDAADEYNLEVYELALTRDGSALQGVEGLPQGAEQQIVQAVFAASQESAITPAINLGSNRTVFFELEEVSPARDLTLDEAREEAIAAWQAQRTQTAMLEAAETMVADIEAGSDLFSVAAARGQVPQTSGTFSRASGQSNLPAAVAQAAFEGPEGYAAYARTANDTAVVFEVTDVTPVDDGANSQVATALQQSFPDLLFSSFVEGLRQDVGVRINQEAVNRVIGVE